MAPLRVLHVTPYYEEAWAYGGIPRAVAALVRAQCARGHEVTVATTDVCSAGARLRRGPEDARTPWVRRPAAPRIVVFRNVSNRLAFHLQLFVPLGMRGFLRASVREHDLVHLHAVHNIPTSLGAHACRAVGKPYLLQPHGTAPLIERRRLAKWVFDRTVGAGVFGGASRWIAVSEAERAQLVALGAPAERVRAIPAAVELGEFDSVPRGALRERLAIGNAPLVLFLGKLTPRKRVDVVVEAFASLRHPLMRLVIAGPDMGAGASLRELVRQRGLGAAVTFLDTLEGGDRLAALADADVVAYPSQDEVLGLVPLEALLCGTPVVIGAGSGCAEAVERVGGGRAIPVGDAPMLARALREMVEAPEQWRAAARAAQPGVRELFGSLVVAARMDDLYAEVAA